MNPSHDHDVIEPAPDHKYCEVHQDALLASRGFYRLSSTLMLVVIFYQKWDTSTIPFWIIVPTLFLVWGIHRYAGRKVEDINYLHSEKKWEKDHADAVR
jgi:hypothetical protein